MSLAHMVEAIERGVDEMESSPLWRGNPFAAHWATHLRQDLKNLRLMAQREEWFEVKA
jgi:hypothetical protein